jgi:RNA polymerase sigma factor (sigma-70 family)
MPQTPVENILRNLDSSDPKEAWTQFLTDYARQIYQVVRHFELDLDRSSDCFQFVCEQLARDRSRRLRKFKGEGSATFSTWLRAVVRNLCIDWHRKEFVRQRPFRSISRLSPFDQEVFRLIYERGIPPEESLAVLTSGFPNVTQEQLVQSRERIESGLTVNQRWLLTKRGNHGNAGGVTSFDQTDELIPEIPDPRPNPEAQAVLNERKRKLERALANLSPKERLLIRLRFEQDLTLDQAAKLLGLGNAQRTDRQLKQILERLRKQMI